MAQEQTPPSGLDLTQGVAFGDLVDGKLISHVGGEQVLLVHSGRNCRLRCGGVCGGRDRCAGATTAAVLSC